ncbi:hypothetical protein [Massilia sp. PWRC2]
MRYVRRCSTLPDPTSSTTATVCAACLTLLCAAYTAALVVVIGTAYLVRI